MARENCIKCHRHLCYELPGAKSKYPDLPRDTVIQAFFFNNGWPLMQMATFKVFLAKKLQKLMKP